MDLRVQASASNVWQLFSDCHVLWKLFHQPLLELEGMPVCDDLPRPFSSSCYVLSHILAFGCAKRDEAESNKK